MGYNIVYIYPRNWDGNPPPSGGYKRAIVQVIGDSLLADLTEEVIVDISELRTTQGLVPTRTVVEWMQGTAENMNNIKLLWDRTPRIEIGVVALPSSAEKIPIVAFGGKADPGIAGDRTGDILLSTEGVDGQTPAYFDITFSIRLKA